MYPSQSKFLLESYDDATKVPNGYLFIDLKPETNERLRIRAKERLQNFVSEQLSELDEKMQSILRNKNMTDSEKVTLYLQILRKYVNFPFPKEINEDMQEPQKEFENSNAKKI
ncbi:hypothetical protein TNCV_1209651 [Trichonephila clavipes]|nr:hypothetical protein TNCV_1209651 [Trichonephila clavipes]